MGTEFAWPLVPAFLVSLVGDAIVLTWLYNRSGGSVFLTMLTHATINTVGAGYIFHTAASEDLGRFWWTCAGSWAAAGAITVILSRFRLGPKADPG